VHIISAGAFVTWGSKFVGFAAGRNALTLLEIFWVFIRSVSFRATVSAQGPPATLKPLTHRYVQQPLIDRAPRFADLLDGRGDSRGLGFLPRSPGRTLRPSFVSTIAMKS